jgi:hypothetical protein
MLTVEQLKDIVAGHAMDTTQLAMKWKTSDPLIHDRRDDAEQTRQGLSVPAALAAAAIP